MAPVAALEQRLQIVGSLLHSSQTKVQTIGVTGETGPKLQKIDCSLELASSPRHLYVPGVVDIIGAKETLEPPLLASSLLYPCVYVQNRFIYASS